MTQAGVAIQESAAVRVLLVDDQELIRSGLRAVLLPQLGFLVVGECAHGGEVLGAVGALHPDVVLMDARMPMVDGIEATRRLRAQRGAPPVLALTTFDDDEVLAGMLRAGAAGFVLKGVPAEELQRAVRSVAAGESWLDPSVTGRVLAVFRESPGVGAGSDPELEALTSRELEVLRLIAAGLTNDEIAERLVLGTGTVKTHVNHIFFKLGVRNRVEAVIFAFDHGLAGGLGGGRAEGPADGPAPGGAP
ncbi:MAG: response regulator transcription factor [Acidobacteriota bacterium]|nr:response regulator transcription factor [Acidobacteriota bacterium]